MPELTSQPTTRRSLRLLGGEPALRARLESRIVTATADAPAEFLVLLPTLDVRGRPDPVAALACLAAAVEADKGDADKGDADKGDADKGDADRGQTLGVLLISSTEVNPPLYTHPGQVAERTAAALLGRHPLSDPWCRYELELTGHLTSQGIGWRVLRPAATLTKGVRTAWGRLFERRLALLPMGFSPPVQFLHEDDLADAIEHAAEIFDQLPPALHLVPEDAMSLVSALRLRGVRRLPVPSSLLGLWRFMMAIFGGEPPAALDRWRYPTTASGAAAAELGWQAKRGTAAAIDEQAPAAERHDPFGLDRPAIDRLRRTAFRFLNDFWWRIDVEGVHHVPSAGPAILLGVHRGLMPFDAMMALHAIVGETQRVPRFLIHPALLRFPFIGDLIRRLGGVVACRENAHWVLERGEILGLFPEGVRGAFAPYREAYQLHRFGRAEFARLALHHRASCALFVTLGSAEVFPILKTIDWRWWKNWSGWPTFPITPTPIPLPVKWHTLFLPSLPIDEASGSADDPQAVKSLSQRVATRLEQTLNAMHHSRRSWFWGRVLDEELMRSLEQTARD